MNKEEFLSSKGCKSVKDLRDEHVMEFFIQGHFGPESRHSAMIVEHGAYGIIPNKKKAMAVMREAMEKGKVFRCLFMDGEGDIDDKIKVGKPRFEFFAV